MKSRIFNIIFCGLVCLFTCLTSCKEEDQTLSTSYLFKPKMIANYPAISKDKLNKVDLIWYKVNAAVSYTIQISFNESFNDIYHEETVTGLSYTTPDLPYDSKIYIRMRTNASDEEFNSIWADFSISTEARDVPPILNEIDNSTIRENQVEISWVVDSENYPVDSISVEKIDEVNGNTVVQEIMLTEDEAQQGCYIIQNLEKASNYKVTLCNSKIESLFDRTYNSVTFKTAGPMEGDIVIDADNLDLNGMLLANESNSAIPDGQRYYISESGIYDIEGFKFTKGFHLIGAPGQDIKLNIKKAFTPLDVEGGAAGKITFNSVSLQGESLIIDNEKEDGMNYTWMGVEFNNCTLTQLPGLLRLNTSEGNLKTIKNILVINCIFNEMGSGKLISVENHPSKNEIVASVEALTITNSTIMNSPMFLLLSLPDNYGYSSSKITLVMRNVTIFESCMSPNNNLRMIAMNRLTNESKVFIDHCLFTNVINSRGGYMFYETCLRGSATCTFAENYRTNEYPETGRKGVETKDLGVSQKDLFVDYENGDLTIKDPSSIILKNEVGDPRWWK